MLDTLGLGCLVPITRSAMVKTLLDADRNQICTSLLTLLAGELRVCWGSSLLLLKLWKRNCLDEFLLKSSKETLTLALAGLKYF